MCPRGEPDIMERGLGAMDDETFRRCVDGWEVWADPVWFHMFGEPLMHPRLFDQIAYAKKAGVPKLALSTNATLLSETNAAKLIGSRLDKIILCIDGNNKETYEAIRKSTEFTYEEVCKNVADFLDMKRIWSTPEELHATVQIIVVDETKDQLEAFKAKWMAAGAEEVVFKEFCAWGGSDSRFAALATAERQAQLATKRDHNCFYMWQGVTVCWDGRVVPCCYDYDATMTMGNLKTQTLREIWNGPEYLALRAAEAAGTNDSSLCKNCTEAPGFKP